MFWDGVYFDSLEKYLVMRILYVKREEWMGVCYMYLCAWNGSCLFVVDGYYCYSVGRILEI